MTESNSDYLKVAKRAALAAGQLLMKRYGKLKASEIHLKSKNDFVTNLDRQAEKTVIDIIKKEFPDHSILGEESGRSLSKGPALWIIDPLDGTANYIHQFPMFSVSIGCSVGGKMVVGVVYDPLHKELFFAARGKGAYLNGDRIFASPVKHLADALMATGIPFRARNRFNEYMKSFRAISLASAGLRRGGSAALDLVYTAVGRLDGFWEINLSPWDIAAGALIIEEAGGKVTDVWGNPDYLINGDILGSNGRIHPELLKISRSVFTHKKGQKAYGT